MEKCNIVGHCPKQDSGHNCTSPNGCPYKTMGQRETVYERMSRDKVFAASVISSVYHNCDYEGDDYDPVVMRLLDSPGRGRDEKAEML
jgi:hypothetical protein